MIKPPRPILVLDDFSGGRNGSDNPLGPDFQPNQVVDAVNVEWHRTRGAKKRAGSTNISMSTTGFGGIVSWLGRFVPGTSEADAELWACDEGSPSTFARLDNSATWTNPSAVQDLPVQTFWTLTSASLNGLFFIAYDSNVARLHCYDPNTGTIRRTGIAPGSNAPTVANTGAGAYAATLRYYRVRWGGASGTTNILSEATPSVSFTPSGAGTAARVTKPTTPSGELITAWQVEASTDNITFFLIGGGIPIATTTFDDTNLVATYSTFPVTPLTGRYTVQKSYRFIAADSNRLVGFGDYTTTNKQNRIEISAVLGSTDIGDAERVDTTSTYYYDLDEKDSGVPKALVGPLYGNFYPFKSRQIWEMVPTGSVANPYRFIPLTKEIGAVSEHAAKIGEDPQGNPCLYFMSHRGVYRYGPDGFTYISRGIEDLLLGPTSTMNMAATKVIAHLTYHPDKRQLWVWFATGSSNDPDTLCVLNVQTGGWARHTGPMAGARCSVLFARSIGATMGYQGTPYVGATATINTVKRCDDTNVTLDDLATYQAYITTRPLEPAGPGMKAAISDVQVLAPVASGVTLTATVTPDFGAQPTKSGTALLTAAGSETRVNKRCEDSEVGDAQFVSITFGDASAANNAWSFDRLVVPVGPGAEPVS